MSLGWQTESALLPSKSTPISVSNSSMVNLKAVVAGEERRVSNHAKVPGRFRHVKSKGDQPVTSLKNRGVNERNEKDVLEENAVELRRKAVLEAKSKVYDEVQKGTVSNELANGGLVDFKNKSFTPVPSIVADVAPRQKSKSPSEYCEIEDEFGRTRQVEKHSGEYKSILLKRKCVELENEPSYRGQLDSIKGEDTTVGPWAWRNGSDPSRRPQTYEADEHKLSSLVKQSILSGQSNVSQEAKIKTQWDKTLHSRAREHLEEIHQQSEAAIQMHQRAQTDSGGSNVLDAEVLGSAGASHESAVTKPHARNLKAERLALLKRKKQELSASRQESSASS